MFLVREIRLRKQGDFGKKDWFRMGSLKIFCIENGIDMNALNDLMITQVK
jgi:hypothetical protein